MRSSVPCRASSAANPSHGRVYSASRCQDTERSNANENNISQFGKFLVQFFINLPLSTYSALVSGSSNRSVFGRLGCFRHGNVLWALFCALREDEQDALKLRQSIKYVELLSRRAYAMNMSSPSDPTSAEYFSPLGYAVMLNLPQLFCQILNASNVELNQPRVRNRDRNFVRIEVRF